MSVIDAKTRTWVKPYQRDGSEVSGYFREGVGHFNLARREFVSLLDSMPTGTRFTLSPEDRSAGFWSLRGGWEKINVGGLPYWFNRDRALHRTSGDFHSYAGRQVLEALEAAGAMRDRQKPGKLRKPQEFLASPQTLVDRGRLASTDGVKPGVLVQREIDNTMGLIGSVHRIGLGTETPPKVPVLSYDTEDNTDANYRYSQDGGVATPVYIRMAKTPSAPEIALTHEFGHYLDQQVFGRRLNFGSRQARGLDGYNGDPEQHPLSGVMRAIGESDAMKRLLALRDSNEMVYVLGPLGETVAFSYQDEPIKKMTDEYLLPEEAFARAYTQYISTRSEDPRMGHAVQARVTGTHPQQWATGDFAPIADAFDALFEQLGWRKGTGTKAAVHVRPYLREGHPVAGYEREILWQPTMSPDLADQWAAGSAIPGALFHATLTPNAISIRKEGFRLHKTDTFGKYWGDGVYLAPEGEPASFWWHKLKQGDMLETRVRVRNVIHVDITDENPQEGIERGLQALFEQLGPNVLTERNALSDRLHDEMGTLRRTAEEMWPNPYTFEQIHYPWVSGADVRQRPEGEAMVAANGEAGEKRRAWLLQHGFTDFPHQEATRRTLMAHGYDAIEINDHSGPNSMRFTGGPQVIVFDPRNVVVVERKLSPIHHRVTVLRELAPFVDDKLHEMKLTYSDGTAETGRLSQDADGQTTFRGKPVAAEDVVKIERKVYGEYKWHHVWAYGTAR